MLEDSKLVGFIATSNAPRAREFFEGKLGLKFIGEDQFAIVFDANGNMLRVGKMDGYAPHHQFTVVGWEVKNVEEKAKALKKAGIDPERYAWAEQNELGVWNPPGTKDKVVWFKDPDGNLLSISEHGDR